MKTLDSHAGYLIIDHTNSPGVPEVFDGRRFSGSAEGQVFEADTFTCCHCNSLVLKNPLRTRPRNVCRKCMKVTCHQASCLLECVPVDKLFDVALERAHRNPDIIVAHIEQLRRDILG